MEIPEGTKLILVSHGHEFVLEVIGSRHLEEGVMPMAVIEKHSDSCDCGSHELKKLFPKSPSGNTEIVAVPAQFAKVPKDYLPTTR